MRFNLHKLLQGAYTRILQTKHGNGCVSRAQLRRLFLPVCVWEEAFASGVPL